MTKPRRPSRKPVLPPTASDRRWATPKQAAAYYQIGERTIRQMIYSGRLTGYRFGPQLLRVDLNEIDALIVPTNGAK